MSEREHLLNMLSEHKVTENEYKVLSNALDKKTSIGYSIFSFAINPFRKIAGGYSLALGLIVIICLSLLGTLANLYFPGVLSALNASAIKNPKIPMSFILLLYQNIACWLILGVSFIVLSKIFKQKRLRIIDFFGTTALARYPYLVLTAYVALMQWLDPSFLVIDYSKGLNFHPSTMFTIFSLIATLCVIWQLLTYFFALKESSGMTGIKLWASFIISIIVGEAITYPITMFFVQ